MRKVEGDGAGAGDYNPIEHRTPEQLNASTFGAFIHLLKGGLGSGILFMPYAFKKTGYVAAITCSIIIGIISVHTSVITVQCCQILCRRARVPTLKFAGTAETAFRLGPEPFRKYAATFALAVNIIVCFVQYETAIVYELYIATSFEQICRYWFGWDVDIRLYILALLPFVCLVAMAPNFSYLVPLSTIGAVFLFFGFFSTCYYFLSDMPSLSRMYEFTSLDQVPIFCSVFLFAVHNMSMIMPIENSMRDPTKIAAVLRVTMSMNIGLTMIFGFLGYNKYNDACDTVIKNLPLEEVLAQIVKVTIALSVLATYGIQYFIPITILWPIIAEKIGNKQIYETCFRLGGAISCILLAIAVPHMAPLLGLFAAISMTTVMLLIPIMIEISTKWEEQTKTQRRLMLVKNAFIFFVWILLMIFGTMENTREIIKAYSVYKEAESEMC